MELYLILLSELPMHRSESGLLSREFLVKVLDAKVKVRVLRALSSVAQKDTHERGEIRRWNPLVHDVIPVDVFKEGMRFDFLCVTYTRTQPPGRILRQ